MSFNLINPSPRLGEPFQIVSPAGKGLQFTNRSGAAVTRGKAVAVNVASTNSGLQDVVAINATTGKYPIVVALADVPASATGSFAGVGMVEAALDASITKGALVAPGTASTGGALLVAASTTATALAPCGIAQGSGDGTTPTATLLNGISRGALVGGVGVQNIW